MSTSQTPIGFSIQEFYIRVIPGSTIVAMAILYSFAATSGEAPLGNSLNRTHVVVLIGISALLVGELIDTFRRLFTIPGWFRIMVYDSNEDESALGVTQRWTLKILPQIIRRETAAFNEVVESAGKHIDIYSDICTNLGLDPESTDTHMLYVNLINHMDGRISSHTRRGQMNYTLYQNLSITLSFIAISNSILLLISIVTLALGLYPLSDIWVNVPLIILFFTLPLIIIWMVGFSMTYNLYVRYFLVDYLSGREGLAKDDIGYE